MALDGPPQAAANATAELNEAGGDFDAAMSAAMADDEAAGVEPGTDDLAPNPTAPVKPDAGKTADEAEKEDKPPVEAKAEKPEPKKDDAKPEDEDGVKLRSGFRALARDRQKIREREATVAAREQAAQQYTQKAQLFDVVLQRLRAGDVTLLQEVGGDELVNKFLDGVIATEKSPAEREVLRMRAELDKERNDRAAREQAQQVESWKQSIRQAVSAGGDAYDLVNSLGQHEAVIQTITDYYAKYNGAILDVETAAQAVEGILEQGVAKSKKFGKREPVQTAQPGKGTPAPSGKKPGSVTLSSVHSSEIPSGDGDDLPLDNDHERFKRVMAAIGA
jgi:hypothetical protein